MGQVISFMNFKGGVGKTTNCAMMGYRLAKRGKKVLLVDMDPQANLTTLMDRTTKAEKRYLLSESAKGVAKELESLYKQLYDDEGAELELDAAMQATLKAHVNELEGMNQQIIKDYEQARGLQVHSYLVDALLAGSFNNAISVVADNLNIIANNLQSIHYVDVVESRVGNVKLDRAEHYHALISYLSRLLDEIRDDYDYILIDVPPTISVYVDSAAYASDWIMGVLQTQTRSLEGSQVLVEHFVDFKQKYDLDLDFIGFICVLQNNRSLIDKKVEQLAREEFGERMVFGTPVKQMERLKRYDDEGILDIDQHDKAVMKVYDALVDELEERLTAMEVI